MDIWISDFASKHYLECGKNNYDPHAYFLNDTFVFFSVLFGYATTVIPRVYTYYVSTALFAIFGIRMLREGLKMSPDEGQEELEEVQAEIKKKDEEVSNKIAVGYGWWKNYSREAAEQHCHV